MKIHHIAFLTWTNYITSWSNYGEWTTGTSGKDYSDYQQFFLAFLTWHLSICPVLSFGLDFFWIRALGTVLMVSNGSVLSVLCLKITTLWSLMDDKEEESTVLENSPEFMVDGKWNVYFGFMYMQVSYNSCLTSVAFLIFLSKP